MGKRLVKIGEAARLMGTSPEIMRKWDASGELPATRRTRGGTRYYSVADLLGSSTIEHKAQWHQREFKRADCWLPSSKTCSACGHKKAVLQLSERTYRCHSCGHTIDRDLNAARNLLAEVQPKRGDDISPVRGNGQATVNEA